MKSKLVQLLFVVACLLVGCAEQANPPQELKEFKQIRIVESGILTGRYYTMFEDVSTGTRIFYFDQSMVVLPPEAKK